MSEQIGRGQVLTAFRAFLAQRVYVNHLHPDVIRAALRILTEDSDPMSLEQLYRAKDAVLEIRSGSGIRYSLVGVCFTEPDGSGNVKFMGDTGIYNVADYGRAWRCWAFDHIVEDMEGTPWTETE